MLLPKTQLSGSACLSLARVFFPLLIVALATASCASTSPSITGSTADTQTENGLSPSLKRLIGTWECAIKHTPAKWRDGIHETLVMSEDNNKLVVLYGLHNPRRRKAEIISYDSILTISFKASFRTAIQLRLMEDNWLDGTITIANDQKSQYAMACLKQ